MMSVLGSFSSLSDRFKLSWMDRWRLWEI